MFVAKFGGTSVSTQKNIAAICKIIVDQRKRNPIVVVSALSGVTDLLISLSNSKDKKTLKSIRELHNTLINNVLGKNSHAEKAYAYIHTRLMEIASLLNKKNQDGVKDEILSYGEIMSSYIIAQVLAASSIAAKQVVATELIVTDRTFGNAEFLEDQTRKKVRSVLLPLIAKKIVPVITGFIGSTEYGQTTTLGRGGSDYSASIIGYCLNASEIQIWTDVDGIFTADPRIVKNAKFLKEISYREASEMAYFGAKVLHPRTIRPAIRANIPVRVLNTTRPKQEGTLIVKSPHKLRTIAAVSFKRNVTLVNIYSTEMFLAKGFFARIFEVFAKYNISVDLVSASEVSVSVTLDNDEKLKEAANLLKKISSVTIERNVATVSLIGDGIATKSHVVKKIFSILEKENISIRMISLGATDINISFVISVKDLENVIKAFHDRLIIEREEIL